jgi:hypothetical protein
MLTLRKVWTVLVGAWVSAWVARALFDWLLGLEGAWLLGLVLAATALGGVASLVEARRVRPIDPAERRDSILGWGAVIGGMGSIACLFLPFPWGVLGAIAVLALTAALLRRVPSRA